MEEREKLAKKVRRIGNSILIADTGLIITTVITGSTSIAAFASGVAIPAGIGLTGTSLGLIYCNNSYAQESFSYECEAEKTRGDSIISSDKAREYSGHHLQSFDRWSCIGPLNLNGYSANWRGTEL